MTDIVYNKNGIPFDIDALASDVNGKMDRDGVNATCPVVVSRTPNSQGGVVEIWSDGYCVQTGSFALTRDGTTTIQLKQTYKNTNYIITMDVVVSDGTENFNPKITRATSSFTVTHAALNCTYTYRTEGYIR